MSGQLIGFVVGVVLARLLVPADFGMIVTIQIFTGFAAYFASGGTGEALVQAKHVENRDYNVVFTLQLVTSLLIYALFYFIAPWFAIWFGDPLYTDLLRVSALSFILRPFANIPRAMLRRAMRFQAITIMEFISLIISSTLSILLAWHDPSPWSLIISGIVGSATNIVLFQLVTHWRPSLCFDREIATRLGGFGLKVAANELIGYFRGQMGNLIISRLSGPSMVGLFNKADSMNALPYQVISGSVYQPVFRALSQVQTDIDQSKYIYFRTITLVSAYTLPFYVGLWWLAEPFIGVVYGPKWIDAAQPLEILALAGLCYCVGHPSGALLAAQNRLGRELIVQVVALLMMAAGCLIGLQWGLTGVAWGVVITHIYSAIHISWLANQAVNARFIDLLRAIKPAALLNAILWATLAVTDALLPEELAMNQPAIYLFVMSALGAISYTLCFLFLPIEKLKAESIRWKRKIGIHPTHE